MQHQKDAAGKPARWNTWAQLVTEMAPTRPGLNKSKGPIPFIFFYFWLKEAGMLIKVLLKNNHCCFWVSSLRASGGALTWELRSLAGVLGGHPYRRLYNTDSCALFGGCCEAQMCNPKSRSEAMVTAQACSTASSRPLALCSPVQPSVTKCSPAQGLLALTSQTSLLVHLLPRLTLLSNSCSRHLLLPEQVSVAFREQKNSSFRKQMFYCEPLEGPLLRSCTTLDVPNILFIPKSIYTRCLRDKVLCSGQKLSTPM